MEPDRAEGYLVYRKSVWMLVVVWAAGAGLAAVAAQEDNPFAPRNSENAPGKAASKSDGEGSPWDAPSDRTKVAGPARDKLAKTLEKRLGQMQPVKAKKKSLDDYWVVGLAEIDPTTLHAEIQFDAKQGQKETAGLLADYILGAPGVAVRRWQVFARFKTAEDADEAVRLCRKQYDEAQEYRDQMAGAYGARTTRRC